MWLWQNPSGNSVNKMLRHALSLGSSRTQNVVADPSNPRTRNTVSILERRFRRMSDNHDRVRARVLAEQVKPL